MSLVAAVIPTHRPDDTALLSLLDVLLAQGAPVMIADDASPGSVDNALRDAAARGATVVRHDRNSGIARSLNDGLRWASEIGAIWLLTVDQDSSLAPDYLERVIAAADDAVATLGAHAVGAVGAEAIDDASSLLDYPVRVISGLKTTEEVIQTGTLWSVSGLLSIGGFDETFGIDAVDAAACVRLRASGRRIILATDLAVGHRIGDARRVSVLGRNVLATGHGPERRTTIVRNRLRLAPEEFAQSPRHAFRTLRRVAVSTILAVTIEDERWAKAKASARGLFPKRRSTDTRKADR